MPDDDVRVPAGWYPDPLGLPQLRWWDNHAWTEHISDARQPMMATETVTSKLAFADDDRPSSERPFADPAADEAEQERRPDHIGQSRPDDRRNRTWLFLETHLAPRLVRISRSWPCR